LGPSLGGLGDLSLSKRRKGGGRASEGKEGPREKRLKGGKLSQNLSAKLGRKQEGVYISSLVSFRKDKVEREDFFSLTRRGGCDWVTPEERPNLTQYAGESRSATDKRFDDRFFDWGRGLSADFILQGKKVEREDGGERSHRFAVRGEKNALQKGKKGSVPLLKI